MKNENINSNSVNQVDSFVETNTKYNFNLMSKERTKIMGFAILWVMFFHMTVNFSNIPVLGLVKKFGNAGVDIFLLMSGIGLYYSVIKLREEKKDWIGTFYFKRLCRILPATIICLLPWYLYLYKGQSVSTFRFILDITAISFWIDGHNRGWYVALTYITYLIYPAVFFLIYRVSANAKKFKFNLLMLFLTLVFIDLMINAWFAISFPSKFKVLDLALCRVPIFLTGCFIAIFVHNNTECSKKVLLLTAGVLVLSVFVLQSHFAVLRIYACWRYLSGIIGLCSSILLSFMFNSISNKWINNVFNFIGKYTLELYLTHTQLLTFLQRVITLKYGKNPDTVLIANILAIVFSFLFAIVIHNTIEMVINKKISSLDFVSGDNMKNERDYSISFCRFVAMCFIVICHIMQRDNFVSIIGGAHIKWAFWFNVGVQMFLFISGFLYGKKEKIDIVEFYKKSFPKVLVNYYIFIFAILILLYWFPLISINENSVEKLLTFSGTVRGLGHLWFIPTMLFCYLLTPIFSEVIKSITKYSKTRTIIESVILLFIFHMLMKYFFRSFTPAWINCFVIGMLYSKTEQRKSINRIFNIIIIVLCLIIIPVQFRIDYWPHGPLPVFLASRYKDFVQYGHTFLGIVIVILLRYVYSKLSSIFNNCIILNWSDKYSYDVYLVHHVFVQSAFGCVEFISNRWIAIPLAIVLTFFFSILLNKVSNTVRTKCSSVYNNLPN